MQTADSQIEREAPEGQATFDIPSVIRIMLGRWRLLAGATLGTGLVMFGLSFLLHDIYRATTIVMPPESSSSSMAMVGAAASESGVPSGALSALGIKSPTDLYVALMSTPGVENAVIQRFDLKKLYGVKYQTEARKIFEANAQIVADEKSGLISISVTDKNPQRAADIANSVVSCFGQLSSHLAITDAARRRLFFEQQVSETRQNLANAEEALRTTKNKTGLIEPQGNAQALIGYQAQLRAQITAKTVELQSLKVYHSDENPEVQTATRELQGLEAQESSLDQKNGGDASDSKNKATDATLQYLRNLRDLRYNEALLELLLKNLEAAKLDEAREGNLVQTVDPATPPDMKYGPHRSFFLAGGLVLGFLLSSAWVMIQRGAAEARSGLDRARQDFSDGAAVGP